MIEQFKKIVSGQREFQKMVDFPVDTICEKERNEISEKYIFKMIEEAVELRKEFPSVVNPWSKSQKEADLTRVKEELSDVLLFLINFINVWKFTPEEILETLERVQATNFEKVKSKKLSKLNDEILKIPGYTTGIGQGNVTPKYVFIGMNPSEGIEHGYKAWSSSEDGSSKILLPILEDLGILKDSYFTNVVKSTTVENEKPSMSLSDFWFSYLTEELKVLRFNNPDMKIIAMGQYVSDTLEWKDVPHMKIYHPSYILRGSETKESYERQIKDSLALDN